MIALDLGVISFSFPAPLIIALAIMGIAPTQPSDASPKARATSGRSGTIKDWVLKVLAESDGLETDDVINRVKLAGGPALQTDENEDPLAFLDDATDNDLDELWGKRPPENEEEAI